jgi:hypothetical protein
LENRFIVDTGVKFGDEQNVVSIRAKAVDDLPVDVLVRDKL